MIARADVDFELWEEQGGVVSETCWLETGIRDLEKRCHWVAFSFFEADTWKALDMIKTQRLSRKYTLCFIVIVQRIFS